MILKFLIVSEQFITGADHKFQNYEQISQFPIMSCSLTINNLRLIIGGTVGSAHNCEFCDQLTIVNFVICSQL